MADHDISYSLGQWQTWTPSATGWSSTTTNVGAWMVLGNTVFCVCTIQGTSNATTVVVTPPITPVLGFSDFGFRVEDNGAFQTGPGLAEINSGVLNVFKDMAGTGFTASGQKEISGSFFYKTQ